MGWLKNILNKRRRSQTPGVDSLTFYLSRDDIASLLTGGYLRSEYDLGELSKTMDIFITYDENYDKLREAKAHDVLQHYWDRERGGNIS